MTRIRSVNIDSYDQAEVLAALNLLVNLTSDIAGVTRHMSPDARKELWSRNNKTRTLGGKLKQISENFNDMDPQA